MGVTPVLGEKVDIVKCAQPTIPDFCQSPKCNSWKHISTLSSPTRFAEFVQGSSHLTQDEVLGYSQVDDWDGEGGSGADEVGDDHLHNAAQLTDDDSSDEVSE